MASQYLAGKWEWFPSIAGAAGARACISQTLSSTEATEQLIEKIE